MKKNTYMRLLAAMIMLLWISCGKEGPQGIPGPAGNPGAAGTVGPAGQDGNALLAGETEPEQKMGDVGDYYLDKRTGNFYGPKTAEGWGDPVTFSSTRGSVILSGADAPAATTGATGDFYLDTVRAVLYGPKIEGDQWGPGILLQGAGPNAGVMAFSIEDPYEYLTVDSDNEPGSTYDYNYSGLQLQIPYDVKSDFDLWTDVNERNDMIEVYFLNTRTIEHGPSSGGQDEYVDNYVPADGLWPFTSLELYSKADIGSDALTISFDGDALYCYQCSVEASIQKFHAATEIKSILVFVISPTAVSNVSPVRPDEPKYHRSNAVPGSGIKRLIEPYLKIYKQ